MSSSIALTNELSYLKNSLILFFATNLPPPNELPPPYPPDLTKKISLKKLIFPEFDFTILPPEDQPLLDPLLGHPPFPPEDQPLLFPDGQPLLPPPDDHPLLNVAELTAVRANKHTNT